MSKIESKIGKVSSNAERIYNFLSDFRNYQSLIPLDKVKNWNASENNCNFSIDGIGEAAIKIVEKEPHSLIKFTNNGEMKYNFRFWIQLKQLEENDSRIKLTIEIELNPMIMMMAKGPVKQFLDSLVDQLAQQNF